MGVSAILGPIVAGFIISANIAGLDWRPIFLINIILGSIGFIGAFRILPHDTDNDEEIIDVPGAGLLGLAMLGMLHGLITGSTDGWTALPIAVLAAGIALLIAFAVNQRDSVNPLIRPSLLKNRGFTAGLLLGLFYFAAVNGLAYVASLFLQFALGRSPAQAALGLAPLMAGIIGASIVSRPLIETATPGSCRADKRPMNQTSITAAGFTVRSCSSARTGRGDRAPSARSAAITRAPFDEHAGEAATASTRTCSRSRRSSRPARYEIVPLAPDACLHVVHASRRAVGMPRTRS